MSGADVTLTDAELAELTPAELAGYEQILEAEVFAELGPGRWRERARPEQLPPEGEWTTLYYRGGRGSGKSFASAHVLAELILWSPEPGQWAVVAPTYADARDTCIEAQDSGLLAALGTSRADVEAGKSRTVMLWNRSLGELRLTNGSVVFIDGADDGALRVQGRNLRGCWADEVGLWKRWAQAWDESIAYALRKGDARLIASGTPKADMPARALVRRLLADEKVITRRLRTFDNRANLSTAFLTAAEQRIGTRLGRQELEGELLEDVEGALWQRDWIDDARVEEVPPDHLRRIVVGLDPADGKAEGAEQALAVCGAGIDGDLYLLRSEGMRASPFEWLSYVLRLCREVGAARIVIEKNYGGQALVDLLEQAMSATGLRVAYTIVSASQGKLTRAEPVAALYERLKVHHVGDHEVLEEQMLQFDASPGQKSPDRLDALVHALTDLLDYTRRRSSEIGTAIPYITDPRLAEAAGAVQWTGGGFEDADWEAQWALSGSARSPTGPGRW